MIMRNADAMSLVTAEDPSEADDIFTFEAQDLPNLTLDGGEGNDTLVLAGDGPFDLTTTTLISIETIRSGETSDIISINADSLTELQTIDGGGGLDTLRLSGGGTFSLSGAVLSGLEAILGTDADDIVSISAEGLAAISTLDGGDGSNVLNLSGNGPWNFQGKTVAGFSRINVMSKTFDATFSDKDVALKVWALRSQRDTLTLLEDVFSEDEREQLHRQGVDTIVDASGTYTNAYPVIKALGERVYTSGGVAFLDAGADAVVGQSDDPVKALKVAIGELPDGTIDQATIDLIAQGRITLPSGTEDGSEIYFDEVLIGTVTRDDVSLIIDFTGAATAEIIEELMHALVYRNLDPDPTSIKEAFVRISLLDEGERETPIVVTIMAGGTDVHFLRPDSDPSTPQLDADLLIGTAQDDTFATDGSGLSAGDIIIGREGIDTLFLLGGQGVFGSVTFDFSLIEAFSGVEIIKGSGQGNPIVMNADQLRDVATIDGGDMDDPLSSSNTLRIVGDMVDLRDKTILDIVDVILSTDHATVMVNDRATAGLVNGSFSANDHVVLVGQTFTAAEKDALFQRHVETISDASGTYVNLAPSFGNLAGDRSFGVSGETVFIDRDRNATVTDIENRFNALTVTIVGGTSSEHLAVAAGGRIRLSQVDGFDRVLVDNVDIGFVKLAPAGSSALEVEFNGQATAERVQELVRALTYRNDGSFEGQREIKVKVADATWYSTEASLFVEAAVRPGAISLSRTSVKELAATGTPVGELTAADPNTGDVVSFQLLNDAGGRFALEGTRLVVKQGIKLDFEQAKAHQITVRATDKQGLVLDRTFTIGVEDVATERVIGSSESDRAVGGRGNDRFYGNLGNDTLTGGRGKDAFVFDTKLGRDNVDVITDFRVVDDTVWLDRDVFRKIGRLGKLSEDAFWIGSRAHDSSDRVIYDARKGTLSYDPDGTGRAAAVQFASLKKGLFGLSEKDFLIV
ncbi:hypothetical protein [Microvirga sp. CF3016]|uniref:hypothetical protein n=1 Tax=Microvirga sp. CF3016 TaxID=3110181 RepID=UPI002E799364|nr:hypothetical protein [Microvirga sp. CF3016]MEE1613044.1 hypothetical protein [Microvirga sp. CF3016]